MKYKSILASGVAALILSTTATLNAQTLPPPSVEEKFATKDTANNDDDKVFESLEIEAKVEIAAWRKHLEKNLTAYIADAANQGMKPGTYTVNVRFLVERDGSISNVKALNNPGFNLAIGSVRVVRTGPKWIAGELNGRKVRSYHTQPITFQIQAK